MVCQDGKVQKTSSKNLIVGKSFEWLRTNILSTQAIQTTHVDFTTVGLQAHLMDSRIEALGLCLDAEQPAPDSSVIALFQRATHFLVYLHLFYSLRGFIACVERPPVPSPTPTCTSLASPSQKSSSKIHLYFFKSDHMTSTIRL